MLGAQVRRHAEAPQRTSEGVSGKSVRQSTVAEDGLERADTLNETKAITGNFNNWDDEEASP